MYERVCVCVRVCVEFFWYFEHVKHQRINTKHATCKAQIEDARSNGIKAATEN